MSEVEGDLHFGNCLRLRLHHPRLQRQQNRRHNRHNRPRPLPPSKPPPSFPAPNAAAPQLSPPPTAPPSPSRTTETTARSKSDSLTASASPRLCPKEPAPAPQTKARPSNPPKSGVQQVNGHECQPQPDPLHPSQPLLQKHQSQQNRHHRKKCRHRSHH